MASSVSPVRTMASSLWSRCTSCSTTTSGQRSRGLREADGPAEEAGKRVLRGGPTAGRQPRTTAGSSRAHHSHTKGPGRATVPPHQPLLAPQTKQIPTVRLEKNHHNNGSNNSNKTQNSSSTKHITVVRTPRMWIWREGMQQMGRRGRMTREKRSPVYLITMGVRE